MQELLRQILPATMRVYEREIPYNKSEEFAFYNIKGIKIRAKITSLYVSFHEAMTPFRINAGDEFSFLGFYNIKELKITIQTPETFLPDKQAWTLADKVDGKAVITTYQ